MHLLRFIGPGNRLTFFRALAHFFFPLVQPTQKERFTGSFHGLFSTPTWAKPFYPSHCGSMKYSPGYGRFRALLRKIREEAGLSQSALAKKLGRPQTFVSKSELGERRVDFLETLEFCAACRVTVSQFNRRLEQAAPRAEEANKPKRRSPRKMDSQGRLTE
jgi:DNA-binding XRE family transcriptional regulator